MGCIIGKKSFPIGHSGVPRFPSGSVGAAMTILKCSFIRCDHAGPCATFNCHVADRHSPLHRQVADGFATIFDNIAGTASGACLADHRQGNVFGRNTWAQLSSDFNFHIFGFFLDQRLGGQNMLNLRCAYPMGQRAKGTVRGGVTIATNNGHAR